MAIIDSTPLPQHQTGMLNGTVEAPSFTHEAVHNEDRCQQQQDHRSSSSKTPSDAGLRHGDCPKGSCDPFKANPHSENRSSTVGSSDRRDALTMRELEDLFSKLNPDAKEFIPPSYGGHCGTTDWAEAVNKPTSHTRNGYNNGNRKRNNNRQLHAQRQDNISRTVYVSDIDQQVTEEQLAALFSTCGQVVDCRVCGDPNSVLHFAFVEFTNEEGAHAALSLAGTMLGFYPVRVLPSKTAIVPVNPTFLPQSEDEQEMCARTIYCTNIDNKVSQAEVKLFFETLYGKVSRLKLLGDYRHSTRIAFVEFIMAESAMAALNCSGAVLGNLPIRVSPSKTPVRPSSSSQSYYM